ncbi:MAG TPA: hypothetical protein VMY06_09530 [Sedimentisphaerales bacterium]|nr:hypothetical protein [Sedimentisphaerales bacterium]
MRVRVLGVDGSGAKMTGRKDGLLFYVDLDRGRLICVEPVDEKDSALSAYDDVYNHRAGRSIFSTKKPHVKRGAKYKDNPAQRTEGISNIESHLKPSGQAKNIEWRSEGGIQNEELRM